VIANSYGSTLSADFFGFARRIYARDWTSHTGEVSQIPAHANTGSYSSYPVTAASLPAPSVTLPRYTFVFHKFVPTASVPTLNIWVTKTSGMQSAVFKKSGGAVSEVAANVGGTSYTVSGFGGMSSVNDEVVLLIANTTNVDNHQANFSTDGGRRWRGRVLHRDCRVRELPPSQGRAAEELQGPLPHDQRPRAPVRFALLQGQPADRQGDRRA